VIRVLKTFTATLVLGTAIFAAPATGWADSSRGGNNIVVVQNSVDFKAVARSKLRLSFEPGDTVDNQNMAGAISSDCDSCRTVAVAMQVVVVESFPHVFTPSNVAIAANVNCHSCQAYAFAYQYVLQPGHDVRLDGSARRAIADLQRQVASVTRSDLDYDGMKAQLAPLFAQFVQVVTDGLHDSGNEHGGDNEYEDTQEAA
jgi:hypothetical protein